MKKEYIPILVEVSGKKELWRLDITNLSVVDLIDLKEKLMSVPYDKTIQILDAIIKKNIPKTIPSHNISNDSYMRYYKKKRKEEKQRKRPKKKVRKYK